MKKHTGNGWYTTFAFIGGILCVGLVAGGLSLFLGASPAQAQKPQGMLPGQVGGEDETGPYDVAIGLAAAARACWMDLGIAGRRLSPRRPNRIYIANRGELPIPEKAPEGYTGGYGAFGHRPQTASRGWSIASSWWTATASCWRIGRSGTISLPAAAARTTSRSAPTIRKNTCGSSTTWCNRCLSSRTTANNW